MSRVWTEAVRTRGEVQYESIISKKIDAPYRSDRNEAWLQVKTARRGEFPVIGFIEGPTSVAAPNFGKQEGNELVHMGKVGSV
ncbi:hypothetical protein [Bradyrhizobium sp. CCBAU 53421]|uniref:hypothetical protein n=1 Tax=Bradyrhizobium sp. CCBAU 53421 TaxID=1325120 RepID=UPI00188DBD5A|nr:hypothetical protein [Bradyrhizobium sp. CCBAU 53421]